MHQDSNIRPIVRELAREMTAEDIGAVSGGRQSAPTVGDSVFPKADTMTDDQSGVHG